MRWPWEHAKAKPPDKPAWLRNLYPGDKEALVMCVEDNAITVRPTQLEYLLYVSAQAGEFFEGKTDVDSGIFVGRSMTTNWPMSKYRDDPATWTKALDLFRPRSGQALTVRGFNDLGYAWFESVMPWEEYYKYRVMMR